MSAKPLPLAARGEQRKDMDNEKLMNRLAALPAPDFMHAHKLSDPIGSGSSYRADTVARLIDEAVTAERERCIAAIRAVQVGYDRKYGPGPTIEASVCSDCIGAINAPKA